MPLLRCEGVALLLSGLAILPQFCQGRTALPFLGIEAPSWSGNDLRTAALKDLFETAS